MILIKGFGDYSKAEQLFPELNKEAMDQIEAWEESGYVVSITNLPSHINTPEAYAILQLDKFSEMYLPEPTNLN
jgi:hypothetical protein